MYTFFYKKERLEIKKKERESKSNIKHQEGKLRRKKEERKVEKNQKTKERKE